MRKILIAAPVKQNPDILREFLTSLSELNKEGLRCDYFFVDDCDNKEASALLGSFSDGGALVTVKPARECGFSCLPSRYSSHKWDGSLIERVACFKNAIIDFSVANEYDYLFLVDSDLVLHKETLRRLISVEKDIVSNIFWTRTSKKDDYEPQVWIMDQRAMYDVTDARAKNPFYRTAMKEDFISMLKEKGTYKVGGLGACTLISSKALAAGVNFNGLYNVSFWGEDRAFCIRAVSLGFELYVDTAYPAYHIYREDYLAGVQKYKSEGFSFTDEMDKMSAADKIKRFLYRAKTKFRLCAFSWYNKVIWNSKVTAALMRFRKHSVSEAPKITLSMVVKNEASAYLEEMLRSSLAYIDSAVIIDDASSDNTAEICEDILRNIPHRIIKNKESLFAREWLLRRLQFEETVKINPDWILFLDADEIFEAKFATEIKAVLKEDPTVYLYAFRRYDFWDEKHYREDALWNAHTRYEPFMLRYDKDFRYQFTRRTNQHCGRMPSNVKYLRRKNSPLRLKHYGWANAEKRKEKFDRYMKLDPCGENGSLAQYNSILDKGPNLIEWKD